MSEKKSSLKYWELLLCIITLALTFQLIYSKLAFNSFVEDRIGQIRFLALAGFVYFFRSALKALNGSFSAARLSLLFIAYLLTLTVTQIIIQYFSELELQQYVYRRVSEMLENSM